MIVFSRIVKILNKLKYSGKFAVIGAVLLIPYLFYVGFLSISFWNDFKTANMRVEATKINSQLKEVLVNLQTTSFQTIAFSNGFSTQEELEKSKDETDKSITELKNIVLKSKYDFSIQNSINEIESKWKEYKDKNWTNNSEINDSYTQLFSKITEVIEKAGNESKLLYLDDKEDFYLVYNTTLEVPQIIVNLGLFHNNGLLILKEGKNKAQSGLLEIYYPIKSDIGKLDKSMQTVFNDTELKNKLEPGYVQFQKNLQSIIELLKEFNAQGLTQNVQKNYFPYMEAGINSLIGFYDESVQSIVKMAEDQAKEAKRNLIILSVIAFVTINTAIYLFIGLLVAIKVNIRKLSTASQKIAEGDLTSTVSLNTNDEMNQIEKSFNKMADNLRTLVSEIKASSDTLAASSQQLTAFAEETRASIEHVASSVEDLAEDAETQTKKINKGVEALSEMATGIEKIAENSSRVSERTDDATRYAKDGNDSALTTKKQMETIQEVVNQSNERIQSLNNYSDEIGKISEVITNLADQTNLLALNASIEAARVGEAGSGFKVVAEEVRKLAEQSSQSAADIGNLISSIQQETADTVKYMEQVIEAVSRGISVTEETAQRFTQILEQLEVLNKDTEVISTTANQFSNQTVEMVSAMDDMSNFAHQNLETSEEVAATSEEQLAAIEEISSSAVALTEMAESLRELVNKFKVKGSSCGSTSTNSPGVSK